MRQMREEATEDAEPSHILYRLKGFLKKSISCYGRALNFSLENKEERKGGTEGGRSGSKNERVRE